MAVVKKRFTHFSCDKEPVLSISAFFLVLREILKSFSGPPDVGVTVFSLIVCVCLCMVSALIHFLKDLRELLSLKVRYKLQYNTSI